MTTTLGTAAAVAAGGRNLPPGYPYKLESLYGVEDPQFLRTMGYLLGPPVVAGNTVETLVNGDEIFPKMLEAIAAAERSVTLETFIYWEGEVGEKFATALSERARAGVKVQVLIDAVGSDKLDDKYVERMSEAGCDVELYNPLRRSDVLSFGRLNHRTHRKLLVIDGKIGFTGGVGIADEWLGHAEDEDHWRDNQYRLTGPAVASLQAAFADHWIEATGKVIHGDDYFPPLTETGDKLAQVFKSGPNGGSESMQLMYLLSFAAARKQILLGTAYLVPDQVTIDTLVEARKRGVQVKIVIPGTTTDKMITLHASRACWGQMLEAGIEIYLYERTMYHCKWMIVDGLWTSVGSANLDNRGFRLNGEANLNVYDADVAAEQERLFEADLKHCHRVTLEEWRDRPTREKLKEKVARVARWQL